MFLFLVSIAIQVGLILHVVRTGRPMYWILIILIAPGIGSIAYFIVEMLPELSNSPQLRNSLRSVKKNLDPGGQIRQRERQLKLSGSVDAARHLAAELVETGKYAEAIEHYRNALTGLYAEDPDLLLGLAKAQFGNERFVDARDTLDRLIEHNPDYRSQEGHLLYARAVEACGDMDKAREEYAAVAAYFAGAEARLRYGIFLEKNAAGAEALAEFDEIVSVAELAPRHYRKAQSEWIREARDGIKRLQS